MELLSTPNNRTGERSKRAACDRCRTQKLRCDRPTHLAASSDPAPCIRCTRLGSVCSTSAAQRLGRPAILWTREDSQTSQQTIFPSLHEQPSSSSMISNSREGQSSTISHHGETDTPEFSYSNPVPSLAARASCRENTSNVDIAFPSEKSEQAPSKDSRQCSWKSAVNVPSGSNYDIEMSLNNHADVSSFDIFGASFDSIMGTVLRMDTAPFPVMQLQPHAPANNNYRTGKEVYGSNQSTWDKKIAELLALGIRFMANIEAYQSSIDTDVDYQRSILQSGMNTSRELLAAFEATVKHGDKTSFDENRDASAMQILVAQASSCYALEARQWKVILSHILRHSKESPADLKTIAQLIPDTPLDGLDLDNVLLQARLFLQACMHTSQALCKQMDSLVDLLPQPRLAPINTKDVLKEVGTINMELLSVLERHHS